MNTDKNIFLVGFMGAGKSTIGRTLMRRTGLSQIEMDARIVEEQGMSINEIFEKFGEEKFRDIESELIVRLGQQGSTVVSCGGGVVLREQNVDQMKKSGWVVYLSAEPETVYERVKNSTDRPILNGHMNVAYIAELMAKRSALYEAAADITVATDGKSRDEICGEILSCLEESA